MAARTDVALLSRIVVPSIFLSSGAKCFDVALLLHESWSAARPLVVTNIIIATRNEAAMTTTHTELVTVTYTSSLRHNPAHTPL